MERLTKQPKVFPLNPNDHSFQRVLARRVDDFCTEPCKGVSTCKACLTAESKLRELVGGTTGLTIVGGEVFTSYQDLDPKALNRRNKMVAVVRDGHLSISVNLPLKTLIFKSQS